MDGIGFEVGFLRGFQASEDLIQHERVGARVRYWRHLVW
jgi:hypothetical protein